MIDLDSLRAEVMALRDAGEGNPRIHASSDPLGNARVHPNSALIPLRAKDGSVRAWAMVDEADEEWANGHRWHLHSGGYACRNRSRRHPDGKTTLLMHKELLGVDPGDLREVDHKNRNRLDNRRYNLRIVVEGNNQQNTSGWARAKSKHRGVDFNALANPRNPWRARVMVNGKMYQSWHHTEEVAAAWATSIRREHMPFSEV